MPILPRRCPTYASWNTTSIASHGTTNCSRTRQRSKMAASSCRKVPDGARNRTRRPCAPSRRRYAQNIWARSNWEGWVGASRSPPQDELRRVFLLGSSVGKGSGRGLAQVRRRLGPQILEFLRCGVATEYLAAVRVAPKARYDAAGCPGLADDEFGHRPRG